MPLFLTEEEYGFCSHDPNLVAAKADSFILGLRRQLESARAEADAASVTAEQTYNVLEQRYAALSSELAKFQAENTELASDVERQATEFALLRSREQESQLAMISKDGEIERMKTEASELHKSKRQLLELLAQKDMEIGEKNATIQSYFDKIVKLTENTSKKEGSLHDAEAELACCQAKCVRLSQEKELIEKHNKWLNEELNDKINVIADLRKTNMEIEEEMSKRLADMETKLNESSKLLKKSEECVKEYSSKIASIEEELISCKNSATANEGHYMAELSTVTKLVDLYKESADEWSKKAGELEGVIKALETHLSQVENDYKDQLEKELSARKNYERDAMEMKEKLQNSELELQNARSSNKLNHPQISSILDDENLNNLWQTEAECGDKSNSICMVGPKAPFGISGTALAAFLLRDGWSLARMYEKYHEAADALTHERWGRKHSEAILERVLQEIEQKADAILEERAEHERLVDAYNSHDQKLRQALLEIDTYESIICTLKAELKKQDRDYTIAQTEISDLQKQVTVLLKEFRDAQIRCGVKDQAFPDGTVATNSSISENGCSVNALTFKDINELVQQNCQLRCLVHNLSNEEKASIAEVKETFQRELQKRADDATSKVEAMLKRCEEQAAMIESLHGSVAMYKRLYEEKQINIHASGHESAGSDPADGKRDILLLFEGSQEAAKKAHEQFAQRARCLEDDLQKSRNEVMELRLERDKFSMEAKFARDKLESFSKELENQIEEANGFRARNVELSQLLIDCQRRSKESSEMLRLSEELSRKLSVEVSVLKSEKEILINAEKRSNDEIRILSERAQRLQTSLDTIHSVDEVREESRLNEMRKLEEYIKHVEKEWADVKKELQGERDQIRVLKNEKERAEDASKQQIDLTRKELSDAWRAVSSAESKAAVAEARLCDLEKSKSSDKVIDNGVPHAGSSTADDKIHVDLCEVREKLEKLKEEAQDNKIYMLQYKEIAQTNEIALKQIELTHQEFKEEASKVKVTLENEIISLKEKVADLEQECALKSTEAISEMSAKEDALSSAAAKFAQLKEECSHKMVKIGELETQVFMLNEAIDHEHKRWRSAQDNYERQVILLSETIQELNKTSQSEASLRDEVAELHKNLANMTAENEKLKVSWQSERSSLLEYKDNAVRNCKEIDEQNKILHEHLEALNIKLAGKELSSGRMTSDVQGESKLQSVINYLRHGKEIGDTEATLLRQEKLRLQSQLESALRTSERLQTQLQGERENAQRMLFTDEEFKSLQFQVREINLLRESNAQLREENRHNFEECQKFHQLVEKVKLEAAQMANEKDDVTQGFCKEIDMLKEEKRQLENRVEELLEKFRNVDVLEYQRLKEDIQHKEVTLNERDAEIEMIKKLLSESQQSVSNLEQEFPKCKDELDELQKKMNESVQKEVSLRSNFEKQKRMTTHFKKQLDNLTKEREGLNKKNQTLLKQIEDYKSGKKISDGTSLDVKKEMEKDTRIQMLEKMLERMKEDLRKEMEENKKEKSRRMKTEKVVVEHIQKIWQEKKKLMEEIRMYKHGVCNVLESIGITVNQLPSESGLEERTVAYFFSMSNFEEAVSAAPTDGLDIHLPIADSSSAETAIDFSGQLSKPVGLTIQHEKSTEQMEKDLPKSIPDARKTVRKLIRPRLEQSEEPAVDTEVSDMECSTATEGKVVESHEEDLHASLNDPAMPSRKRLATTSMELREDSFQHESESEVLSLKKTRITESLHEDAEEQPTQPSVSSSIPPIHEDAQDIAAVQPRELVNEGVADAKKEEKLDDPSNEPQGYGNDPTELSNQGDEERIESDTILDLDRTKETVGTVDEMSKHDEVQELPQPTMLAEDDVEEGELAPGDQDLQLEDGELGGHESTFVDATAIEVAETDEGAEVADVGDLNDEKTDNVGNIDEKFEISGKTNSNEQTSVDVENQIASSTTHLPSSNVPVDASSTEQLQQPTSAATGTNESHTETNSRTIDIAEMARQNSALRQARMMTRARGRGRASGGSRGDATLGGRGGRGRGGRGQTSNERDQG